MNGLSPILPALLVLLASCGERQETAAYFTKVTGLPLCSDASVRNVNSNASDRSPGFDSVYVVDLSMPPSCRWTFVKAVGQRIGAQCDWSASCSGNGKNGNFYKIEPRAGGFRVTYST